MKDFFATPACDWRRTDGSVHLYLIPDGEQRRELSVVQERLAWSSVHARQPPEFLHATVLRLPWFETELDPAERESVQRAVTLALYEVPSFSLAFDTLELSDYGVVMTAPAVAGWDRLVVALEQGLAESGVAKPSPGGSFTRPFGPHVSLSYGQEDAEDAHLAAVVAQLRVQQRWNVNQVELVAVSMHKERGTYSWQPVSTHGLAAVNEE